MLDYPEDVNVPVQRLNVCKTRSAYRQCKCLWCGKYPHHASDQSCPVDERMRWAIVEFARLHGRTWKFQLWQAWSTGKFSEAAEKLGLPELLQRFRNTAGPTVLVGITPRMLNLVIARK